MLYLISRNEQKIKYFLGENFRVFLLIALFGIACDPTSNIGSCVTFGILVEETDLIVFPAQWSFLHRAPAVPWSCRVIPRGDCAGNAGFAAHRPRVDRFFRSIRQTAYLPLSTDAARGKAGICFPAYVPGCVSLELAELPSPTVKPSSALASGGSTSGVGTPIQPACISIAPSKPRSR